MAEQHFHQQWKECQQPYNQFKKFQLRIIVAISDIEQQLIQDFGLLLLQLSFLSLKYDVILSGQNQPVFLKQKEEALTISLLDEILHALIGKCNRDFIIVNENSLNNNDLILVFTKQLLEMSTNCKTELQNEGFSTVIQIQDQNHFNTINIKNGQIISSSKNLIELLNQIENKQLVMKKQMLQDNQEKEELKQKISAYNCQMDFKAANSLKGLLEITKFTKYSLSSKGTTIDIKGIIKFFCTNGTARDILRRKNRGGKSLYVFEVVLDLSSFSKRTLIEIILPFLYQLIEICKECQLVCNLMILNNDLIIIKSNFSTSWTDLEYTSLIQNIIDCFDEVPIDNNIKTFQQIFEQFERFINYKKYLIFINHSFYNYQFQEFQQIINMAQQKQIKIVSLGVDINKYINRFIEGVIQYSLSHSKESYLIMQNLFSKVLDAKEFDGIFMFQQNINQYPKKLQLEQFYSKENQINCYLNKYFNFQKDENNYTFALTKVDPFMLLLELEIRRLEKILQYFGQSSQKEI